MYFFRTAWMIAWRLIVIGWATLNHDSPGFFQWLWFSVLNDLLFIIIALFVAMLFTLSHVSIRFFPIFAFIFGRRSKRYGNRTHNPFFLFYEHEEVNREDLAEKLEERRQEKRKH